MPEGDTIYRTAERLRSVLRSQTICEAQGQWHGVDMRGLKGRTVQSTEARGKHLLIHLDNGHAIHSHLGMTGSWHVYRPQQPWRKPRNRMALALHVSNAVCVCFTPKTLEILSTHELRRHPYLSRLGPDLLTEPFDMQDALRRFGGRPELTIGEALMNQTLVCGIGNVYKSELLFLEQIDPFVAVGELSASSLRQLLNRAATLMRRNLQGFRRTTRFGRDGQRLWVYDRRGESCLRCGVVIQMQRQGDLGRSTYWCPTCQRSARE